MAKNKDLLPQSEARKKDLMKEGSLSAVKGLKLPIADRINKSN